GEVVWWSISLSLLLSAAYLRMNRRSLGRGRLLVAMHALLLLALWWLGAFTAPAARLFANSQVLGWPPRYPQSVYYPIVTSGYALLTVLLGCPLPGRSSAGQSASEEKRPEWLAGYAERVGAGLVVLSLLFTCEKIPRN